RTDEKADDQHNARQPCQKSWALDLIGSDISRLDSRLTFPLGIRRLRRHRVPLTFNSLLIHSLCTTHRNLNNITRRLLAYAKATSPWLDGAQGYDHLTSSGIGRCECARSLHRQYGSGDR